MTNQLRAAAIAILVVVGNSHVKAAPVDDSITLHYSPPRAKTKWTENKHRTVAFTTSVNGTKRSITTDATETKTIEVLAVVGDSITKANYGFKIANTQTVNGTARVAASSIDGKTYTLTAGTPIGVAGKAGPVPAIEADEVREHEKRFGRPDRFGKMLDGKRFAKGAAVAMSATELAEAMRDEDVKITKLTLTYRAMTAGNAVFDAAMTLEQSQGGTLKAEVVGELVVDPKTAVGIKFSGQGALKISGPMSGEGTMKLSSSITQ